MGSGYSGLFIASASLRGISTGAPNTLKVSRANEASMDAYNSRFVIPYWVRYSGNNGGLDGSLRS